MRRPTGRCAHSGLIALICLTATWLHAGTALAAADPQLRELLVEAARNSPEVRASGNERLAARHRVLPAGALDDPMLEAGVINAPLASRPFRREDMTMKMLGVSQKIPYPGKRELRQYAAAKDAELVAYGYDETLNRVLRDVKIAYFELALAVESARAVERNKQVLEQFVKISESRYGVGQGSQADVLKAQTQLSRMIDELIKLARERRATEADLMRALGRTASVGAPVPAPLRLSDFPLDTDALLDAALRDRPQILGLKTMIERNTRNIELARKDYYPDFDVRLSYGQRDRSLEGLRRDDMVSLTVAINLPVWRETKRDPRVAEAIALRDQAADMLEAQRNELASKLRQQVASADQSLKSARLYETGILPQARLAVESSLAAYRVNRVDFLTLLDSQMTVLTYEISHASALAAYNKAIAEIELLTGKSGL